MKGFLVALQYGSSEYQLISVNDLDNLHFLIGEKPYLTNLNTYIQNLQEASDDLRMIYNFNDQNVLNWRLSK